MVFELYRVKVQGIAYYSANLENAIPMIDAGIKSVNLLVGKHLIKKNEPKLVLDLKSDSSQNSVSEL